MYLLLHPRGAGDDRLGRVRAPCFVAHSSNDDIASLRNVRVVERGVRAPVQKLLLDDSYHLVTIDRERAKVIDGTIGFFREIVAQREAAWSQHAPLAVAK